MGWKLAVSGKGGVGKSTLSALLAHQAASEGKQVLAIDADPDANLAAALGMAPVDRAKIVPISQHRALIEERTGAKVKQYGQIFKLNPQVSDIAHNESAAFRGIHLLVLGAIESGGSGCACPESVLLKALMTDVVLFKDDCVILDMEAGLEHLGRATAQGVDVMVVVVEPGSRALETAASVQRMAAEIGLKRVVYVGNKVMSSEDEDYLRNALGSDAYLGSLPFNEVIRRADRDNLVLFDHLEGELQTAFESIRRGLAAAGCD